MSVKSPTAEQVAFALADCLEPIGAEKKCVLCRGVCLDSKQTLHDHHPGCAWRLAREWQSGAIK